MNIENLEKASSLHNFRETLKVMLDIMKSASPMVVVFETTSFNSRRECTWDKKICEDVKKAIENRISEIEKEVECL
jgi:hypothetical protein